MTAQDRQQAARACGALTRVRRACLWRAQQAVPTSTEMREERQVHPNMESVFRRTYSSPSVLPCVANSAPKDADMHEDEICECADCACVECACGGLERGCREDNLARCTLFLLTRTGFCTVCKWHGSTRSALLAKQVFEMWGDLNVKYVAADNVTEMGCMGRYLYWRSRVCARSCARYHEGAVEYRGSKVPHLFHGHSYHRITSRESALHPHALHYYRRSPWRQDSGGHH